MLCAPSGLCWGGEEQLAGHKPWNKVFCLGLSGRGRKPRSLLQLIAQTTAQGIVWSGLKLLLVVGAACVGCWAGASRLLLAWGALGWLCHQVMLKAGCLSRGVGCLCSLAELGTAGGCLVLPTVREVSDPSTRPCLF